MLRKSAGDPRLGGLVNPLAGRAVSHIRWERWASRNCRGITHTGASKRQGQAPHRGHGWRSRGIKTGERFSQYLTMRTVKH